MMNLIDHIQIDLTFQPIKDELEYIVRHSIRVIGVGPSDMGYTMRDMGWTE